MHARVTAILVARSGAARLERTLAGLDRQLRRPDAIIAVDAGSTDASAELLAAANPTQLVSVAPQLSFGSAVARALQVAPVTGGDTTGDTTDDNEWLWLLAHDSAPEPAALQHLLAAVEVAPSVAVAGPKLMRWEQPDVIAEFGETMTRFGASIPLVESELDQAQHDLQQDVLGVAATGMLVRRSLWAALGGFDPGLPSIDAALDFSVRARLAGFRVIGVPSAKVASAGGAELFGRTRVSDRRRASIARSAQLHRRLVYAPTAAVPFHWLSLLPLALLRALGHLIAKRPGFVFGEIGAGLSAAFGAHGVPRARRTLRRSKRVRWSAIAPLRMPPREVRERRGQAREAAAAESSTADAGLAATSAPLAGFITHAGLWVVAVAAVVGVIAWGGLLGANSVTGGTLLPLSTTVPELWANVGYGWRDLGLGFTGAADPFAYVLAVLGSITFWSPSYSVVLVYVLALPLAALGAWFAARRVSERPWVPAIIAILWTVAPSLAGSLAEGHFAAVIAHILLPWLVLASLGAARSWASAAGAGLLFAAIAASAPILIPALLLCWIALIAARPRGAHRLLGIPIPAAALFAPLVIEQFARGTPLALFAEPGAPVGGTETDGLHLALGSPVAGLQGWDALLTRLDLSGVGLTPSTAVILIAVLVAPIGILSIVGLFLPGSKRTIPAMVVALLGFATAVIVVHIAVTSVAASAVPIWSGPALSLFWLGLLGSLATALDQLRKASIPLAALTVTAATAVALPMLGAALLGTAAVAPGGRTLPAVVSASAQGEPRVGTLVLDPLAKGALAAHLERGNGETLDDQSTLDATRTGLHAGTRELAVLSGNLASHSGFDAASDLRRLGIEFVLLSPANGNTTVHSRASEALDGNSLFTPVGTTSNGLLWRYDGAAAHSALVTPPTNTSTSYGATVLIVQGVVFLITVLIGIPSRRRRRNDAVSGSVLSEPSNTFGEDDDD